MAVIKREESERKRLFALYGDKVKFLQLFNPGLQTAAALDPARCYFGTAPTVAAVARVYGNDVVASWLEIELRDLANYSGQKEKLSGWQSVQTATNILVAYGFLNMAELLLFFARFKAGKYGRFYGVIDPLVITTALSAFCEQRNYEISMYEMEKARLEREKESPRGVSREEFLRIKERADKGDRAAMELLKPPTQQERGGAVYER